MSSDTLKAFEESYKHWDDNSKDFLEGDGSEWFNNNCTSDQCPLCKLFGSRCFFVGNHCPLRGTGVCGNIWNGAATAASRNKLTQTHIDNVRDALKKELDKYKKHKPKPNRQPTYAIGA